MRTPHTAQLFPQNEETAGKLVKGYTDGDPVSIPCQITPSDSSTIFESFGVEVRDAWLLMANPGTQDLFTIGDRVEFNGMRFGVASKVRPFLGFGAADHYSVALEAVND